MEIEILEARTGRTVASLSGQTSSATIGDIKERLGRCKAKYADVNRQELRLEAKGKFLKDEETLESLGINENTTLFFGDIVGFTKLTAQR